MAMFNTTRLNYLPVGSRFASIGKAASCARVNFDVKGFTNDPLHKEPSHGILGPRGDTPHGRVWKGEGNLNWTSVVPKPTPNLLSRRFSTTSPAAETGRAESGVPDWAGYRVNGSADSNRTLSYFMVGALGALTASGAKSTVSDILSNMAASADVLALAKIEVEMSSIPEGKNLIVKWRGKPVFIRHRTPDEIKEADAVDVKTLRDPQTDQERTKRQEWLVMLGVCTHLGCVPIGEAGDYGGWFCPCHGSHYDISGRVRRGPAPLNLEIPQYDFDDDAAKISIG